MKPYSIHFTKNALDEAEKLDASANRRITKRVEWLAENLDRLSLQPLKGRFSGLYKLRAGDYRVIYEIVHDRRAVVIHHVGHRKDVYDE